MPLGIGRLNGGRDQLTGEGIRPVDADGMRPARRGQITTVDAEQSRQRLAGVSLGDLTSSAQI
jgi:hypothetical protein